MTNEGVFFMFFIAMVALSTSVLVAAVFIVCAINAHRDEVCRAKTVLMMLLDKITDRKN